MKYKTGDILYRPQFDCIYLVHNTDIQIPTLPQYEMESYFHCWQSHVTTNYLARQVNKDCVKIGEL